MDKSNRKPFWVLLILIPIGILGFTYLLINHGIKLAIIFLAIYSIGSFYQYSKNK